MVRNYVRKTTGPSYSLEDLENAIQSVKSGRLSMYGAAKTYKVPKATLFKYVKGQRGVKSQSYGRPTALPFKVEEKMANGLKTMEKWCVKFVHRIRSTPSFHWPQVDDIALVKEIDIVMILPPPTVNKRGKVTFNLTFESNIA